MKNIWKKGLVLGIIILFIGAGITPNILVENVRADIGDGLIGYWSFDESSGSTASDSAGDNDGVIYGATWTTGISGSALEFDGVNDYVEIPDVNDFVFNNEPVTFSAWVQIVDNIDEYRTFIFLGDADYSDYHPYFFMGKSRTGYIDGRLFMDVVPVDNVGYIAVSDQDGEALPKNSWIHIVGVFDYENLVVHLYVNGNLEDTVPLGSYDLGDASQLKLRFGMTAFTTSDLQHKGLLDEVRIYNRALSEGEIEYLYNNPGGGNIIYVPDDYSTIQAAVDAASLGDTVFVYSGMYYENVVIDKTIDLVGEDKNNTIIDGDGLGDVVKITADSASISGFTIQNSGSGGSWPNWNAGIVLYSNFSCFSDNNISNNRIGISLIGASNNNIFGNSINSNSGSCIYFYSSNDNNISENTISCSNEGIYLDHSNNNFISDNTIFNTQNGIRIWNSMSNTFSGNTLFNNYGSGICFWYSDYNICTRNIISDNHIGIGFLDRCMGSSGSSDNIIYLNNFMNDKNLQCPYSPNIWSSIPQITYTYNSNTYTNYMGNYWDDYTGSDADGDGIGDTPYSIDGDNDNYPIVESFKNYTIGVPAGSPWPMFRHNARHTGSSSYLGAQNSSLKWSYSIGGASSSPAIDLDGTVYIAPHGKLLALNPNGTLKWFYDLPVGAISHGGKETYSSPAVDLDGTIYIGSVNHTGTARAGKFFAINPNGTLKWSYDIPASVDCSPTIGLDGTIYFGAYAKVYAFNPNGTLKWSFSWGGGFHYSSPAIGPDSTIYIGWSNFGNMAKGELLALNQDGTLKWSYSTLGYVESSPAIGSDGTIYISSAGEYNYATHKFYNARLYALNPNGTLKWSYIIGGVGYTSSPAIDSEETIYIGSRDPGPPEGYYNSRLYAINPNGTLKWSYLTGRGISSSPTIGLDGTIYFGSQGMVYSLNPDGTLKWSYSTGYIFRSELIISIDGTIYFSDKDYLYAIGSGPGNQPPNQPNLKSPGTPIETGYIVNTLTPIFEWDSVSNADHYALYISRYPYGTENLVFDSEVNVTGGKIFGNSFDELPDDVLDDGEKYRWNMRAHNSAGWSGFSNYLYFEVNLPPECNIILKKDGREIEDIIIGDTFDICVTDYSDDITEVRFLSDENQNGKVDDGFSWTIPYDWELSSGDWNAETKTMKWSFATGGAKEIWAEVNDTAGQTNRSHADIYADVDSDGDGLTDREEIKYGTYPNKPDSDGDGLSDLVEVRF